MREFDHCRRVLEQKKVLLIPGLIAAGVLLTSLAVPTPFTVSTQQQPSSVPVPGSGSDVPLLDLGKRRVTETIVRQSTSHNAVGHA